PANHRCRTGAAGPSTASETSVWTSSCPSSDGPGPQSATELQRGPDCRTSSAASTPSSSQSVGNNPTSQDRSVGTGGAAVAVNEANDRSPSDCSASCSQAVHRGPLMSSVVSIESEFMNIAEHELAGQHGSLPTARFDASRNLRVAEAK